MKRKLYLLIITAFTFKIGLCQNPNSPKLIIAGSEAMHPAVNAIANEYKRTSPTGDKLYMSVSAEGSGHGFLSLLGKNANLVASTRKATAQELEEFNEQKVKLKEFMVAKEALTIVVSKENPVYRLTAEQVGKIFSGEIKNWNEVGGEDEPIVIFIRSNSSGCYEGFKNVFFKKDQDYAASALMLPSNQKIKEDILKNKNAISFLGYNAAAVQEGKLKLLKIAADNEHYVMPNQLTIDEGSYKIVRYCYLYTTEKDYENNLDVKNFIDFSLSTKSKDYWDDNGFWPVLSFKK